MKRYFLMVVSMVLVIVSLLSLFDNNEDVVGGAGNADNAKITKLSEIQELLYFVGYAQDKAAFETDEEPHDSQYKSVTIYNDSYADISNNHVKLNRTMVVYKTENECYYVTKGAFIYEHIEEKNGKRIDYNYRFNFDFEMLISNYVYIKFDIFDLRMDGEALIDISDFAGKWIKVPEQVAKEMLELLDETNASNMKTLNYHMNNNLRNFIRKGNQYLYKDSTLRDNDTKYIIDLTDSDMPCISFVINGNGSNGVRAYSSDKITFANINNTVIDVNIEDAIEYTAEEFDMIFGGNLDEIG